MTIEILMPALSPAMDTATLARWLVEEGAVVRAGDVIAEAKTEQATLEIEAAGEGRLGKILIAAGTSGVKVNTPIALLLAGPPADVVSTDAEAADREGTPERAARPAGQGAGPPAHQSLRDALHDAIAEEMRRDPNVVLLGRDVAQPAGAWRVTQGLAAEFGPRRVIDAPASAQALAGIGVGASLAGLRPVVEFSCWATALDALDHIANAAAKMLYVSGGGISVPIVFRGPNGPAPRIGAREAQCLAAWLAHVPGLKVVAPSCPADAKGLMRSAIRDPGPVLVLESEPLYETTGPVADGADDGLVPIGVAAVVRRGRDVTVVSFGSAVRHAAAAATSLARDGIEAEVIDLRSLRPLDTATVVQSVLRTGRLVTVEDAWPVCSIGSEICATVARQAFAALKSAPVAVTAADVPLPYAANLETLALPDDGKVAAAVRAAVHG